MPHPTYGNQRVPVAQLLAKLSTFDNGSNYRQEQAAAAAPSSSSSRPNSAREVVMSAPIISPAPSIPPKAKAKAFPWLASPRPLADGTLYSSDGTGGPKGEDPYAQNKASTMGTLLFAPPEEESDADFEKRIAKQEEEAKSRAAQSLIGGQPGGHDMWKTSQQLQNEGEPAGRSKSAGSKRILLSTQNAVALQVSPITGQPTADYGTWREDAANKLAYEQAAAQAKQASSKAGLFVSSGHPLLDKLRLKLRSRGANGLLGLSRLFRSMDDDNSKSLDMNEFKKAMRDMQLSLSQTEVQQLFTLFDRDGEGSISYDEFISVVRGPMNDRRKGLIRMAFEIIDKDGSGTLDISDIIDVYDVAKHPDYLSKKKTKEKILSEFLDNLTAGEKGKGEVSYEGFEDYYANISASVDSDDYFELMMRNAWHISGGEGVCANSTNKRVLVTNADGSQAVVEIKNDLGLKAGDKAGMMARLAAQGEKSAMNLAVFGTAGDDSSNKGFTGVKPPRGKNSNPNSKPPTPRMGIVGGNVSAGQNQVGNKRNVPPFFGMIVEADEDISHPLLDALREKLLAKGAKGLIGLQRAFRVMDDDGSQSLNMSEFKKAMKEMNMVFKRDSDVEVLFRLFDRDRSGSISYDEFLVAIRGKLNDRRKALVGLAFNVLDKDGSGVIEPSDLIGVYDTSKHPDVLARRKTPDQALREFLDGFDVGGVVDGKVTREEFENYYSNISASIDDDDYFELMIRNAWHISGGTGQAANSSNRRVLVTRSDGTQGIEEIKNDLGLKNGDKAGMIARLKAQGVDVVGLSTFDGADNRSGGKSSGSTGHEGVSSRGGAASIVERLRSKAESTRANRSPDKQAKATNNDINEPPPIPSMYDIAVAGPDAPNPTVAPDTNNMAPPSINAGLYYYIAQLKNELKKRPSGYADMQQAFEEMDSDGSKSLNLAELKAAFKNMNIAMSENDLRRLFTLFDRDESGTIDFSEFIEGIRTPLTPNRLRVVQMVFSELASEDGINNELLDFEDIAMRFNGMGHPEVLARRMNTKQALQLFLDSFVGGTEVDGKVTLNEFVNYYTNVGAAIENDNYFDLLVRNVWGVADVNNDNSNGKGYSESKERDSRNKSLRNGRGVENHGGAVKSNGSIASSVSGSKQSPLLSNSAGQQQSSQRQKPMSAAASRIQRPMPGIVSSSSSQQPSPSVPVRPASAYNTRPTTTNNNNQTPMFNQPKSTPTPTPPIKALVGTPGNPSEGVPPAGLAFLIDGIKASLKAKGDAGYTSLLRIFHSFDDDGDKTLSLGELKKALKALDVVAKENEVRLLFEYFDNDNSETISFEEFLTVIRMPLSDRRLALVRKIFNKLDTNRNDAIDIAFVASSYQPMQHPEVLAGTMTAKQVLNSFLETFDAGGEVEGKVTRNEFITYYTNIGAAIDDDNYFDNLLQGVWGLDNKGAAPRPATVTAASKEDIKALKTQAVLKYNQREYQQAMSLFDEVLQMLQQTLPPSHADCLTVGKSIAACRTKLDAMNNPEITNTYNNRIR